jgi:hypothetical protein
MRELNKLSKFPQQINESREEAMVELKGLHLGRMKRMRSEGW